MILYKVDLCIRCEEEIPFLLFSYRCTNCRTIYSKVHPFSSTISLYPSHVRSVHIFVYLFLGYFVLYKSFFKYNFFREVSYKAQCLSQLSPILIQSLLWKILWGSKLSYSNMTILFWKIIRKASSFSPWFTCILVKQKMVETGGGNDLNFVLPHLKIYACEISLLWE